MNAKKLFGAIAGLAVLAGLSWHQTRTDLPGAGMEDLMTGTALETPAGETHAPEISSSHEIAAEQECQATEEPGEKEECDSGNGQTPNNQSD